MGTEESVARSVVRFPFPEPEEIREDIDSGEVCGNVLAEPLAVVTVVLW